MPRSISPEARVAHLERENASLVSASEEATSLLEHLAAENARLRAASEAAAREAPSRAQPQPSPRLLNAAVSSLCTLSTVAPALLPPSSPSSEAPACIARISTLLAACTARSAARTLLACVDSGGVVYQAADGAVSAVDALLQKLREASGDEVGEAATKAVEELRARTVALATDGERAARWPERVAKLKSEGLRKAVAAVVAAVGGAGDAGITGKVREVEVAEELRTLVGSLQSGALEAARSVEEGQTNLREATEKIKALEADVESKNAAVEDLTVRCAVFEKKLDASAGNASETNASRELEDLRKQVAEKDALIAELRPSAPEPSPVAQTTHDVQHAEKTVSSKLSESLLLNEALDDLAASRANEARLRRALARCHVADLGVDEGCARLMTTLRHGAEASNTHEGHREGDTRVSPEIGRNSSNSPNWGRVAAVQACLRRTRMAAAEARVVVLADVENGVKGRPGRSASICDAQRALSIASGGF